VVNEITKYKPYETNQIWLYRGRIVVATMLFVKLWRMTQVWGIDTKHLLRQSPSWVCFGYIKNAKDVQTAADQVLGESQMSARLIPDRRLIMRKLFPYARHRFVQRMNCDREGIDVILGLV